MSRTFRKGKNRRTYHETVRDGKGGYKCRCNWCINPKYKFKNALTVKDNLNLDL